MIIQSEVHLSVLTRLEEIANDAEKEAEVFLKKAILESHQNNQTELLYSDRVDYEILSQKADVLSDTVKVIRNELESNQ